MRLEIKSIEVSDSFSFNSVSKAFTEVLLRPIEPKCRIWTISLSKIADASLIVFSVRRQDENSENEVAEVSEE